MKRLIPIFILLLFLQPKIKPCNICGGGTGELIVLALDGRALFNAGMFFDSYRGIWDQNGKYLLSDYTKNQYRFSVSAAYRFNKLLQVAVTIPYIANYSNVPGLKSNSASLGDIVLNGRLELLHEFQLKKKNGNDYMDRTLPYVALTFGLTLPTGKSDEDALNDVDVTGKGFFMSSLGVSVTKSLIESKLQVSADFSWQHSFKKTYDKQFGVTTTPFVKQQGDKFNYSLMFNYIFSSWHAVSLSVSGYSQNAYTINNNVTPLSDEHNLNFTMMYTYYPSLRIRVTPQIKWNIPTDNIGKNSTGSTTFGVNLTYYFEDYFIK